jgi:hypothetical protein
MTQLWRIDQSNVSKTRCRPAVRTLSFSPTARGIAREILRIEGEKAIQPVLYHRGNQARVMNTAANYLV